MLVTFGQTFLVRMLGDECRFADRVNPVGLAAICRRHVDTGADGEPPARRQAA
jgi:hypothetical protein